MTVYEAAICVLREIRRPAHAKEIMEEIERRGLYKFGAKDPISVVSQALRKHVTSGSSMGADARSVPRIEKVAPNTYVFQDLE